MTPRELGEPCGGALDELVREQVLLSEQAHYRFAHQALRSALVAHMSAEARRELHACVAEGLL